MRKDIYAPGGGPALAGLLPALQGEISAGGNHHKDLLPLWKALQLPFFRQAVAQNLPVLQGTSQFTRREAVMPMPALMKRNKRTAPR